MYWLPGFGNDGRDWLPSFAAFQLAFFYFLSLPLIATPNMMVIATITSKVTVLFVRQRNAYLEALISSPNPAVVILHSRAFTSATALVCFAAIPASYCSRRGMVQDPAGGGGEGREGVSVPPPRGGLVEGQEERGKGKKARARGLARWACAIFMAGAGSFRASVTCGPTARWRWRGQRSR